MFRQQRLSTLIASMSPQYFERIYNDYRVPWKALIQLSDAFDEQHPNYTHDLTRILAFRLYNMLNVFATSPTYKPLVFAPFRRKLSDLADTTLSPSILLPILEELAGVSQSYSKSQHSGNFYPKIFLQSLSYSMNTRVYDHWHGHWVEGKDVVSYYKLDLSHLDSTLPTAIVYLTELVPYPDRHDFDIVVDVPLTHGVDNNTIVSNLSHELVEQSPLLRDQGFNDVFSSWNQIRLKNGAVRLWASLDRDYQRVNHGQYRRLLEDHVSIIKHYLESQGFAVKISHNILKMQH
jgi:hypothetical protein